MKQTSGHILKSFATVFTVAILFMSCGDDYQRVGEEAVKPLFPQGVAQNFTLTYTETVEAMSTQDSASSRVVAVLRSPLSEDFDNQRFKFRTFPKGLQVDFYDEKTKKVLL